LIAVIRINTPTGVANTLWDNLSVNVVYNTPEILSYEADMKSRQMYYPGGMPMPNEDNLNAAGHTYGFNGKENDNEISGNGNSQDFGARLYNPRLNRWFATDQLESKYPELSPYNFVANNPIILIDPDGKDIQIGVVYKGTHKGARPSYKPSLVVTYKNGALYTDLAKGIKYEGNNEFILKVKKTLDNLAALGDKPGGGVIKQRLEELQKSGAGVGTHQVLNYMPRQQGKQDATAGSKNKAYDANTKSNPGFENGSRTQFQPDQTKKDYPNKKTHGSITDEVVLAHELLGHGYSKSKGDVLGVNEENASINIGNLVRELDELGSLRPLETPGARDAGNYGETNGSINRVGRTIRAIGNVFKSAAPVREVYHSVRFL